MFRFHLLMNGMDKMIHVMTLKEILSVFLSCVDIVFIFLQNFITKFPFMEFKCRRRYFNYISHTVFFYFTLCYIPSMLWSFFSTITFSYVPMGNDTLQVGHCDFITDNWFSGLFYGIHHLVVKICLGSLQSC